MRPASGHRSAAARSLTHVSATGQKYAELLQVHVHATALGQPLLTEAGLSYVRQQILPPRAAQAARGDGAHVAGASLASGGLPHWDSQSRRLWLGGLLVK